MEKIEMKNVINYFAHKYNGDWDSIYTAIQNKEKIELYDYEKMYESNKKIPYISIIDEKYPENYKGIYMPPLMIYYAGDASIMNHDNIISLWGNIDEDTFVKMCSSNRIIALKLNNHNLSLVKKYATKQKIILVDYMEYNEKIVDELKDFNNVIYISEIPYNSNRKFYQNMPRMLLGISNKAIFVNKDDEEFQIYKNIACFEKRKLFVYGNINEKYLEVAEMYKNNN